MSNPDVFIFDIILIKNKTKILKISIGWDKGARKAPFIFIRLCVIQNLMLPL
jgi:hypothetical protein